MRARAVTDLLADLVARGLHYEQGILVVIDGSKALAAGVRRVFGRHAGVQRCTLHKRRNLKDYLDKASGTTTDRKRALPLHIGAGHARVCKLSWRRGSGDVTGYLMARKSSMMRVTPVTYRTGRALV